MCPGGPFSGTQEIWCNKEGQYTIIVADYSGSTRLDNFEVSVCSFAVMGTKYQRNTFDPIVSLPDQAFAYRLMDGFTTATDF